MREVGCHRYDYEVFLAQLHRSPSSSKKVWLVAETVGYHLYCFFPHSYCPCIKRIAAHRRSALNSRSIKQVKLPNTRGLNYLF